MKQKFLFYLIIFALLQILINSESSLNIIDYASVFNQSTCQLLQLENGTNTQQYYSGYLQVNATFTNSSLFYTFYGAQNNQLSQQPLLISIGGSNNFIDAMNLDLLGYGPLMVNQTDTGEFILVSREINWNQYNLLFIDYTIGQGLSYVQNTEDIPESLEIITQQLYNALQNFFNLECFSNLRNNDVYFYGLGYGAKISISLSNLMVYKNMQIELFQQNLTKINLKGLLTNGVLDLYTNAQEFVETQFQNGDIDIAIYNTKVNLLEDLSDQIQEQNFSAALTSYESIFFLDTGNMSPFDLRLTTQEILYSDNSYETSSQNFQNVELLQQFLNSLQYSQIFNIPYYIFMQNNNYQYINSTNYYFDSIQPQLENLLNQNIRINLISGQDSGIGNPAGLMTFINNLNWTYNEQFRNVSLMPINNQLKQMMSFSKSFQNLYLTVMTNTGDLIFYDQPQNTLEVIQNFIANQTFSNPELTLNLLQQKLQVIVDQYRNDIYKIGLSLNMHFPQLNGSIFVSSGYSNYQNQTPFQINDHFRIGSITKTFVAASILLLYDQNLISLNDTIQQYFEDYNVTIPNGNNITIFQMLHMQSGLYSFSDNQEFLFDMALEPEKNFTISDILQIIVSNSPVFEPGTQYEYSNSNFFMLALIIQKITNQTLSEFLTNNIFNKFQLNDTYLPNTFDLKVPFSHGYMDFTWQPIASLPIPDVWQEVISNNRSIVDATLQNANNAYGCGNLVSTVQDLTKWAQLFYGGQVLSKKGNEALFTLVNVTSNAYSFQQGCGFQTQNLDCGGILVGHDGALQGFNSFMGYDLGTGITMATFENNINTLSQSSQGDIANQFGYQVICLVKNFLTDQLVQN